jgi:sortase A
MRKVVLCIFSILAILFGTVLGMLYPLRDPMRLIKSNTPFLNMLQHQTSLPTISPTMDVNEEDALLCPANFEANGYNSPLPSKSPSISSDSDEDLKETASGILGRLIVDNQSVNIYSGIDEETLKNGPGWMPDSVLPGIDGMSVIFGHRNRNHLKIIENVQVGDEISFCYLDGRTISYNVTEVQIFENSADWLLPQPDGNMLVIVTCYPFRYSGNAPGKFQVLCERSLIL